MAKVLVNTNLAAAAGVLTALAVSRPILGRFDLFAVLNGAIAGLVAITAGPSMTSHYLALIVGGIGAVVCIASIRMLEKFRIDDVVGAVPAHLFSGIWGTLAVSFTSGGDFLVQLLGVCSIGVFVFGMSYVLWKILASTTGVRVSLRVEKLGQDVAELGIDAYPEFVLMPEDFGDEEDEE